MNSSLKKGLRAAVFLSLAIALLAGGCHHPRWTPENTTAVSHEVSQSLVGKQITIRGKFSSRTKDDPCLMLDNQQEVWIGPRESALEQTYSRMDGKLVEATGTLKYDHNPTPVDETVQRELDHFYFEKGSTQLRLVSH